MTANRFHGLLALAAVLTACVCATVAGASSTSLPPPGRIVYAAATPALGENSYSLFTAAADGTGARQITSNASGGDTDARWSPDGTQVAFTRIDPTHFYTSVWVVNADGTNAHRVSGGPGYSEFPKWSPDGRRIAFQEQTAFGSQGARDDTSYELWIASPDGSGLRSLDAGGEFGDSEPSITYGNAWAWAPDGKRIAFVHTEPGYDDEVPPTINVLNLVTGGNRRLTTGTYPAWSPNGAQIAFIDDCRIWVIPAKGGTRKPVTLRPPGDRCISDLRWSPDGRWIAATASSGNGVDSDPLVARSDGKRQYEARFIRPAAVRWPRDCTRLFFYPVPHLDFDVVAGGWIVHGPHGLPRLAPVPAGTYEESQVDWRC